MVILKPIIIKNSLTSLSVSFCNFEKSLKHQAFPTFKNETDFIFLCSFNVYFSCTFARRCGFIHHKV